MALDHFSQVFEFMQQGNRAFRENRIDVVCSCSFVFVCVEFAFVLFAFVCVDEVGAGMYDLCMSVVPLIFAGGVFVLSSRSVLEEREFFHFMSNLFVGGEDTLLIGIDLVSSFGQCWET